MTAIIVLSHGSRHPGAEHVIRELARKVAFLTGTETAAAFLDFHPDDLRTVCARLAARHADAIVVPLLFTSAYHARIDVPRVISAITSLKLTLANPLGTGRDIAKLLDNHISRHAAAAAPIALYPVGSSDPAANAGVDTLAYQLSELSRRKVRVVYATGNDPIHPSEHVLPLFVTHGLLLDKAHNACRGRVAPPLGTALAPIVAQRAQEATCPHYCS